MTKRLMPPAYVQQIIGVSKSTLSKMRMEDKGPKWQRGLYPNEGRYIWYDSKDIWAWTSHNKWWKTLTLDHAKAELKATTDLIRQINMYLDKKVETVPISNKRKRKLIMSSLKDPAHIRAAMNKVYSDLEDGTLSHSGARVRINAARVVIDTWKIEIMADSLGRVPSVFVDHIENEENEENESSITILPNKKEGR